MSRAGFFQRGAGGGAGTTPGPPAERRRRFRRLVQSFIRAAERARAHRRRGGRGQCETGAHRRSLRSRSAGGRAAGPGARRKWNARADAAEKVLSPGENPIRKAAQPAGDGKSCGAEAPCAGKYIRSRHLRKSSPFNKKPAVFHIFSRFQFQFRLCKVYFLFIHTFSSNFVWLRAQFMLCNFALHRLNLQCFLSSAGTCGSSPARGRSLSARPSRTADLTSAETAPRGPLRAFSPAVARGRAVSGRGAGRGYGSIRAGTRVRPLQRPFSGALRRRRAAGHRSGPPPPTRAQTRPGRRKNGGRRAREPAKQLPPDVIRAENRPSGPGPAGVPHGLLPAREAHREPLLRGQRPFGQR